MNICRGIGLLALVALVAGCIRAADKPPAEQPLAGASGVRLDFRPFFPRQEFSHALFVQLDGDGRGAVLNYSPHGLAVFSFHEGTLNRQATEEILRSVLASAEAKAARPVPGTEGDPFTLSVKTKAGHAVEIVGMLQTASAGVRETVEKLVALRGRLALSEAPAAYLQCTAITKELAAQLRRGGKARFVSESDFPAELRATIPALTTHSFGFGVLTAAQRQSVAQFGDQFFLSADSSTYQLTMFSPAKKAAEESKP